MYRFRITRVTFLALTAAALFATAAGAPEGVRGTSVASQAGLQPASGFSPLLIDDAHFTEDFDSLVTFPPADWVIVNLSDPIGIQTWFLDDFIFPPHSGTNYARVNFNSAATTGGDISNWLILPEMEFRNGNEFAFWTRAEFMSGPYWPDRLEVRLSRSGASIDVGSTVTSVGDFDTVLEVINPDLLPTGYPSDWTRYSMFITGLPEGATAGRLAFRYDVTDSGLSGNFGSNVAVDTVSWYSYQPGIIVATTVSTSDATCSSETEITVDAGSEIYLCQTIHNQGNTALSLVAYQGPFDESQTDLPPLPAGDDVEYIDGPFTILESGTLATSWTAGNPEREIDPMTETSHVSVTATPVITGVSVTPATGSVLVGSSLAFEAIVSGLGDLDPTVAWSSSDTSVATVTTAGVATGVAAGTATITATSNQDNTVAGTATITVEAADPDPDPDPDPVRTISVTGTDLPAIEADAGDRNFDLIEFTIEATGNTEVTITAFEFTATGLTFSEEPEVETGIEALLETLQLTVDTAGAAAAATFTGSSVTLTLDEPLVIPAGGSVTVTLTADASASLAGNLAVLGTLAAAGIAGLGLSLRNRRIRMLALLILLAAALAACRTTGPGDPDPITATFTTQLTAIDSDAEDTDDLPIDGADITITY